MLSLSEIFSFKSTLTLNFFIFPQMVLFAKCSHFVRLHFQVSIYAQIEKPTYKPKDKVWLDFWDILTQKFDYIEFFNWKMLSEFPTSRTYLKFNCGISCKMKNCLSQDFFQMKILWKHANCLLKHSLISLKLYKLKQKKVFVHFFKFIKMTRTCWAVYSCLF